MSKHDLKARQLQVEEIINPSDQPINVGDLLRYEQAQTYSSARDIPDIEKVQSLIGENAEGAVTVWSDESTYSINDYVSYQIGDAEYLFRSNFDANTEVPTLDNNTDWQLIGATGNATIDDSETSLTKVWSSSKTDQQKQNRPILTSADLSTAQVSGDFIYGLIDQFTGEYVNLVKIPAIPSGLTVDKIVIFSRVVGGVTTYYQRVFEAPINFFNFGAKGDGVTDDNSALQTAINTVSNWGGVMHILQPKSFYKSSKGLIIARALSILGKDSSEQNSELSVNLTKIVFDRSAEAYGINITSNSASAGTILHGFTVQEAGGHKGGYILGYNSVDGKLMYMPGPSANPVSGDTMQSRTPAAKLQNGANAEFTVTSTPLLCTNILSFYGLVGVFTVGQTITSASGATMVISFVGEKQSVVCGVTVVGTFTAKSVITTDTGSAFVDTKLTITTSRVMDVALLSGSIGSGHVMYESGYFKTGILMQRRAHISEVRMVSFSGCGGAVPGDISNVNCFIWEKCAFTSNGYNGLNLEGTDANAGSTESCTFVNNMGFAINDISFLGNTHKNNHSSSNFAGAWFAGTSASRSNIFLNCYSESSPTRYPFPDMTSTIGGGGMALGGTRGVNIDYGDYISRGIDLSWDNFRNGFIDTYVGPRGKKLKVFAPVGFTDASAFAVSAFGNQGSGRGVGIDFFGQNDLQTDIEYASIFATRSSNEFNLQLKVREFTPYSLVIKNADGSATSGTNGKLVANVIGGVFTSVEVIRGGSGYNVNSIITITLLGGEAITTPAVLYPVIMDGVIDSVKIFNGGAGYLNSGFKTVAEIRKDCFMPSTNLGAALGRATFMFSDTYTQRLRTGAGLHQITSGTGSPEGIIAATPGSIYFQTDGSADQVIWTKRSGTTTTGWGLLSLGPKLGTLTVNGTGQTTINIPHGLGAVPTFTNVNPKSVAARNAGILSWTEDATNIIITLAVPAETGTNNLSFVWEAKL
jgi:hypothetical protein